MNPCKLQTGLLALAMMLAAAAVFAGDPAEPDADPAMEAWMQAGRPGEQHEWLAQLAGEFDLTATMWSEPSAEPAVSKGTSVIEAIFGGRYMREKMSMEFDGMMMEGLSFTGYDKIRGSYFSTWGDNMSTGLMLLSGDKDDRGRLVMTGIYRDPLTKKDVPVRSVTIFGNEDGHVFEYYETRPGMDEFKTMEITYARRP